MSKYNVHAFTVVRVKYEDIEADTPEAALKLVEDMAFEAFHETFKNQNLRRMPEGAIDVEFAEEFSHWLVDVVGDEDFEKSEWYDKDLKRFDVLNLGDQQDKCLS